jgi:hypothetical protein
MPEPLKKSFSREIISDNAIPRLAELSARGIKRPTGVSRYEFAATPDGPHKQDGRWREITEKEASTAKSICTALIAHIFRMSEKFEEPLRKNDLVMIYDLATKSFGLSRYEAEELAPDNLQWLIMCITPDRDVQDMNTTNLNAG